MSRKSTRINGLPVGSVISCGIINFSNGPGVNEELEIFGTSTGSILFVDSIKKYTNKWKNLKCNGPIKSLAGFQKEF
jgi:hypothetical protein